MNAERILEERLSALGEKLRADTSAVDSVMSALQTRPAPSPCTPRPLLRWMAAAAVCAAAVLLILFIGNPFSLHDRMVAALEQSRTVHVVGEELQPDGSWKLGAEMWYDRDHGVREEYRQANQHRVIIDNGTRRWERIDENPLVLVRNSVDRMGKLREFLRIDKITARFRRAPDLDRTVDGALWRGYVEGNGSEYNDAVWLDGHFVRAWEERRERDDGTWETYRHGTVFYDEPVSPALFAPDFGPDVRIVGADDPEAMIELVASENTVIASCEAIGLTFAAHRAQRVEDGRVLVVVSLRPAPGSPVPEGELDGFAYVGLDPNWRYAGEAGYVKPLELATVDYRSLNICWWLVDMPDPVKETFTECGVLASLHVNFQLADAWRVAGLETYQHDVELGPIPVTDEAITLDAVLRQTYEEALLMEGALRTQGAMVQVRQLDVKLGKEVGPNGEDLTSYVVSQWPTDMPLEKFLRENRQRIEELDQAVPLPPQRSASQ